VVALRDRVVVKASDLSSWLVPDSDWKWGLKAPPTVSNKSIHTKLSKSFISGDEKYKINIDQGESQKSKHSSVIEILEYIE